MTAFLLPLPSLADAPPTFSHFLTNPADYINYQRIEDNLAIVRSRCVLSSCLLAQPIFSPLALARAPAAGHWLVFAAASCTASAHLFSFVRPHPSTRRAGLRGLCNACTRAGQALERVSLSFAVG
jgi:hypothetical protein